MDKSIKKINVKIGTSQTVDEFDLGAKAENVNFSTNATEPFQEQQLEDSIPSALQNTANSIVYAKPYIRNNNPDTISDYINQEHGSEAVLESTTGYQNIHSGGFSISYGQASIASGYNSQAFGFNCLANGWASHAEGYSTIAGSKITEAQGFAANYAHAEGGKTVAINDMSHSEGDTTNASGFASHTEGRETQVFGMGSHAEGYGNIVGDDKKIIHDQTNSVYGQSELDIQLETSNDSFKSYINGQFSHAEGINNTIYGAACHAEGFNNKIDRVCAATVMGQKNEVRSDGAVAMGSYNTIPAGHPDCLMIGTHGGIGENENNPAVLVIGGGDESHYVNLMTVRRPTSGLPSRENRGNIWAEHLNAHFATVTQGPLEQDPITHGGESYANYFWRANPRPIIAITGLGKSDLQIRSAGNNLYSCNFNLAAYPTGEWTDSTTGKKYATKPAYFHYDTMMYTPEYNYMPVKQNFHFCYGGLCGTSPSVVKNFFQETLYVPRFISITGAHIQPAKWLTIWFSPAEKEMVEYAPDNFKFDLVIWGYTW